MNIDYTTMVINQDDNECVLTLFICVSSKMPRTTWILMPIRTMNVVDAIAFQIVHILVVGIINIAEYYMNKEQAS